MASLCVAFLVWLLGGYLGWHYVYLGRDREAVIFAQTGGMMGMGWLLDLFRLPLYVREANRGPATYASDVDKKGGAALTLWRVSHGWLLAYAYAAVAQLFWGDHKPDKARKFFARATALDRDNGDAWAAAYAFELAAGSPEEAAAVEAAAVAAAPRHGDVWARIAKAPTPAGARAPGVAEVLRLAAAEMRAAADAAAAAPAAT
jgi:hypothetical protein